MTSPTIMTASGGGRLRADRLRDGVLAGACPCPESPNTTRRSTSGSGARNEKSTAPAAPARSPRRSTPGRRSARPGGGPRSPPRGGWRPRTTRRPRPSCRRPGTSGRAPRWGPPCTRRRSRRSPRAGGRGRASSRPRAARNLRLPAGCGTGGRRRRDGPPPQPASSRGTRRTDAPAPPSAAAARYLWARTSLSRAAITPRTPSTAASNCAFVKGLRVSACAADRICW